jgi:hypothetical protein
MSGGEIWHVPGDSLRIVFSVPKSHQDCDVQMHWPIHEVQTIVCKFQVSNIAYNMLRKDIPRWIEAGREQWENNHVSHEEEKHNVKY